MVLHGSLWVYMHFHFHQTITPLPKRSQGQVAGKSAFFTQRMQGTFQ